jgi:hypothetical protein
MPANGSFAPEAVIPRSHAPRLFNFYFERRKCVGCYGAAATMFFGT